MKLKMLLKGFLFLVAVLGFAVNGVGQDTAEVYLIGKGLYETGQKIVKTKDENFLILGSNSSISNGESDIYLIKLDSNLNILWSKTYGTEYIEKPSDMIEDQDGNIVIVGFTNGWGYGLYDIYCIKLDSLGTIIWEKSFGSEKWDFGNSILQLPNKNYIITGTTFNDNNQVNAIFYCINQNGDEIWKSIPHSEFKNDAKHSILSKSNNIVACGYKVENDSIDKDFFIYQINSSNGKLEWKSSNKRPFDQELNKGLNFNDTNYFFVGYSTELGSDLKDYFIVKTDSLGNIEFNFRYFIYPEDDEEFADLIRNKEKISLLGYTKSIGSRQGWKDFQFLEVDQNGGIIDGYNYGGNDDEIPESLIKINSGFYLLGTTLSFGNGLSDICLVKINNNYSKGEFQLFEIIDSVGQIISDLTFIQNYEEPKIYFSKAQLVLNIGQNENFSVEVFDLLGRNIYSGKSNEYLEIDSDKLPSICILRILFENNSVYTYKVFNSNR